MENTAYDFEDVDVLKRERDVEGELGIWMRVTDTIFLHVLCQSDANPRFRTHGMRMIREIQRQANAGATPAQLDRAWAHFHAECVVLGWRGVNTKDGTPVPFSKAAYVEWAARQQRIRFIVEEWSKEDQNFRRSMADSIAGQLGN
ncbi:MAG: hypothetical protein FD144_4765 [Rhodospirillaceae bacterium]|nr:MAG: hypothetical protein FD144_4765 [Rhodospirillaceae bacterium]